MGPGRNDMRIRQQGITSGTLFVRAKAGRGSRHPTSRLEALEDRTEHSVGPLVSGRELERAKEWK